MWVHRKSNQHNYIKILRNWIRTAFHFLPLDKVQNSLQYLKHEKPLKMRAARKLSKTPIPKVERKNPKEVELAEYPGNIENLADTPNLEGRETRREGRRRVGKDPASGGPSLHWWMRTNVPGRWNSLGTQQRSIYTTEIDKCYQTGLDLLLSWSYRLKNTMERNANTD